MLDQLYPLHHLLCDGARIEKKEAEVEDNKVLECTAIDKHDIHEVLEPTSLVTSLRRRDRHQRI